MDTVNDRPACDKFFINAIKQKSLPADCQILDIQGNRTESLDNLSKINFFVGSNNSGKSRLIRHIFSTPSRDLFVAPENIDPYDFVNNIIVPLDLNIQDRTGNSWWTTNAGQQFDIIKEGMKFKDGFICQQTSGEIMYPQKFREIVSIVLAANAGSAVRLSWGNNSGSRRDGGSLLKTRLGSDEFPSRSKISDMCNGALSVPESVTVDSLYIPILRGLRHPYSRINAGENRSDNLYETRTRHDFFSTKTKDGYSTSGEQSSLRIFTGLDLYTDLQDMLLGDIHHRNLVRNYEEFLERVFFNEKVNLIPRRDSDVVVVKIGEQEERPIYDLGDGIQALICITFPLFRDIEKKQFVFIEELETHLHPALQRILVTALINEFPNHQFFVSTHSNHVLDLTFEYNQISVYRVIKPNKHPNNHFICQNVENGNNNVLEDLGVRNSSVFLANCTIWVEGITDRLYVEKYLRLYIKHLGNEASSILEDFDYTYMEYGGSNITHWSFLSDDGVKAESLCGRLFLIADKDDSTKKLERKEKLEASLGERFHLLDCREIENSISPEVLGKVVSHYEGDNVDAKFSKYDYANKGIGNYIQSKLGSPLRQGGYAKDSGTIKGSKPDFCRIAISHMKSYESLSPPAQALAKAVYEFIISNKN